MSEPQMAVASTDTTAPSGPGGTGSGASATTTRPGPSIITCCTVPPVVGAVIGAVVGPSALQAPVGRRITGRPHARTVARPARWLLWHTPPQGRVVAAPGRRTRGHHM